LITIIGEYARFVLVTWWPST